METRKENTAAGSATPVPADPYSPENLLYYHTSMALVENLVNKGVLSRADYKKCCQILTKKYGLSPDSIFAEIA